MKYTQKHKAVSGFFVIGLLLAVQQLHAVGLRDTIYAAQRKICTRDGALIAMGVVTTYCLMRDVVHEKERKRQMYAQISVFKSMREEIDLLREDVRRYAQSLADFSVPVIQHQQHVANRLNALEGRIKPLEELFCGKDADRCKKSFRYNCLKTLLSTGVRVDTSTIAPIETVGSDEDAYSTPMGAGVALANFKKTDSLSVAANGSVSTAASEVHQKEGGEAQNTGGCLIS